MARRPRLLLVTTSLARGGAERQVVDLATGFRSRGWDVAVLSMTPPSDHQAELLAAGAEVASLDMSRGQPTPGSLLRYARYVRRWRPDVIHSHMVHANLMARVGRVFAPRVPVVSTVHNLVEGARWREIAYRVTDPLASATTAVSEAATERYIRVGAAPRKRIVTVPNGFDFSRSAVPDGAREAVRAELHATDDFLWVAVGRLVPEKGHDRLIRAFATVHDARPEARLGIAGMGPLKADLDRLVVDLGLTASASILGERKDVPSILAAADAFVLSSLWEGLPMVLLEAAAQGLPIVSTDVGGCRDVAVPELGAILVDGDAPDLATAMLRIMDLGPEERARIGRALQDHVRTDYDLSTVLDTWEALYGRVRGR